MFPRGYPNGCDAGKLTIFTSPAIWATAGELMRSEGSYSAPPAAGWARTMVSFQTGRMPGRRTTKWAWLPGQDGRLSRADLQARGKDMVGVGMAFGAFWRGGRTFRQHDFGLSGVLEHISEKAGQYLGMGLGVGSAVPVGIWVFQMVLERDFGEFRIQLVPETAPPSPPAPEDESKLCQCRRKGQRPWAGALAESAAEVGFQQMRRRRRRAAWHSRARSSA